MGGKVGGELAREACRGEGYLLVLHKIQHQRVMVWVREIKTLSDVCKSPKKHSIGDKDVLFESELS